MKVLVRKNKLLEIRYITLLSIIVLILALCIVATIHINLIFLIYDFIFLGLLILQIVQLYKYKKAPVICVSIDNDKKIHLYKNIVISPKDINSIYYEDTYVPKSIITNIGKVIIETKKGNYEYNYIDNLVNTVSELKSIVIREKQKG